MSALLQTNLRTTYPRIRKGTLLGVICEKQATTVDDDFVEKKRLTLRSGSH
ncbi:hypothetical protein KIN20_008418 [Parelaphostrongylus tenuis]|uniref:Uncharacterized protein n=1 Tax=Parelaphostrongylus tenuis TaxID=148309 RepID=A0AAD5QIX1_PARTN|nr:hypothetical protein KIN20_008418 [Parelaphostrongylus tenuis]